MGPSLSPARLQRPLMTRERRRRLRARERVERALRRWQARGSALSEQGQKTGCRRNLAVGCRVVGNQVFAEILKAEHLTRSTLVRDRRVAILCEDVGRSKNKIVVLPCTLLGRPFPQVATCRKGLKSTERLPLSTSGRRCRFEFHVVAGCTRTREGRERAGFGFGGAGDVGLVLFPSALPIAVAKSCGVVGSVFSGASRAARTRGCRVHVAAARRSTDRSRRCARRPSRCGCSAVRAPPAAETARRPSSYTRWNSRRRSAR